MVDPRNPQAAQMTDESMIRTLAAEAEAPRTAGTANAY
jgi:hypothetical protein